MPYTVRRIQMRSHVPTIKVSVHNIRSETTTRRDVKKSRFVRFQVQIRNQSRQNVPLFSALRAIHRSNLTSTSKFNCPPLKILDKAPPQLGMRSGSVCQETWSIARYRFQLMYMGRYLTLAMRKMPTRIRQDPRVSIEF